MQSGKKNLSMFGLFILSMVLLVGCGYSPPSQSDFSEEVITEVPEVPGADEPYPLPKLKKQPMETKEMER